MICLPFMVMVTICVWSGWFVSTELGLVYVTVGSFSSWISAMLQSSAMWVSGVAFSIRLCMVWVMSSSLVMGLRGSLWALFRSLALLGLWYCCTTSLSWLRTAMGFSAEMSWLLYNPGAPLSDQGTPYIEPNHLT